MSLPNTPDIIRLADLLKTVPLSASTIYRMVKLGKFPSPVNISTRARAWRKEDIISWLQSSGGKS